MCGKGKGTLRFSKLSNRQVCYLLSRSFQLVSLLCRLVMTALPLTKPTKHQQTFKLVSVKIYWFTKFQNLPELHFMNLQSIPDRVSVDFNGGPPFTKAPCHHDPCSQQQLGNPPFSLLVLWLDKSSVCGAAPIWERSSHKQRCLNMSRGSSATKWKKHGVQASVQHQHHFDELG